MGTVTIAAGSANTAAGIYKQPADSGANNAGIRTTNEGTYSAPAGTVSGGAGTRTKAAGSIAVPEGSGKVHAGSEKTTACNGNCKMMFGMHMAQSLIYSTFI